MITPAARPIRLLPVLHGLGASLLLALSGCGTGADEMPGSVTKEEAAALDAAAEMLETRDLSEGSPPTDAAAPAPQPS